MDLRLLTSRSPPTTCSPSRPHFTHRRLAFPSPLALPATPRIRIRTHARLLLPRPAAARSDRGAAKHADDTPVLAAGIDESDGSEVSVLRSDGAGLESPSIWKQMKEIAVFAGPASGLWICGPLMSLIDTMVIGQGSSLELAAMAFVGSENLHLIPAANSYIQPQSMVPFGSERFAYRSVGNWFSISICTARYERYVPVHQVTGTWIVRYRAVPPKSTVGDRLREKKGEDLILYELHYHNSHERYF
ncbi:hypothetical protein GW17_00012548 [Ensete ventricosum]|nr:hypothetical protein GW17_00012548 [Ensete ventricosum]